MSSKKRKREAQEPTHVKNELDTSKPTAVFKPTEGRAYTVSIAVPGSIIANAQSPDLKTQLAGRIARALAVFCVDEVVVFDDGQTKKSGRQANDASNGQIQGQDRNTFTGYSDPNYFLMHVLSYLETPPYLRTMLFPMHPDFQVTLKFPTDTGPDNPEHQGLTASPVAPSAPREEGGYYWGYDVRSASSLSAVLTECSFDGGYDVTFGTSERGVPISALQEPSPNLLPVPQFNHLLIVFGGIAGLEVAVNADDELQKMGVTEPSGLFDYWVDLCPGQGSRTIRTEEAVWLGLMGLRNIALSKGKKRG
ncbi:hypothetical protein G7Y79_00008g023350 [Physcia stellaris]|nr:hypothetical protein G7Y79_00008g023350 [Physcia stellaris]